MDARLTINLADNLFEIADKLEGARRVEPSQAEPPRAMRPTVPRERRGQAKPNASRTRPQPSERKS